MAEKKVTAASEEKKTLTPVAKTTEAKVEKVIEKAEEVIKAEAEKVEAKAPAVKKTAKAAAEKATKTAAKATKAVAKTAEAVKKETAKKATARKATTTKKKTNVFIQYNYQEIAEEVLVQRIIDKWVEETGNKESSIKSFDVYIKPEDNAAYYVVNGQGSSIALF